LPRWMYWALMTFGSRLQEALTAISKALTAISNHENRERFDMGFLTFWP
jgi:hypothetical protein